MDAKEILDKKENLGNTENKDSQVVENDDEKFEKVQETLKKVSSNYDRLNTDYQKLLKQLDEEKKKTLSAKEIEELNKKEYEKMLADKEEYIKNAELKLNKTQYLTDNKLDIGYLDLVSGSSMEEFEANVKKFKKKLQEMVDKEVSERLKTGNVVPKTGKEETSYYTIDELRSMNREDIRRNYTKYMDSMTKLGLQK